MASKNQRLLIATRNPHKTGEFAALLGQRFLVEDLRAHPEVTEIEETGTSFLDNSALKALAASKAVPQVLVLADDSGIEVDALGGAPGIRSARYAGPRASDADNRALLLEELRKRGARGKERSARFRCALTLARAGEVVLQTEGVVEGILANREKGHGGFGYDPLFIPEGHCETFGELPSSTKDALSHRSRALQGLLALLEGLD